MLIHFPFYNPLNQICNAIAKFFSFVIPSLPVWFVPGTIFQFGVTGPVCLLEICGPRPLTEIRFRMTIRWLGILPF